MNEGIEFQTAESREQPVPIKLEYEISNSVGGNAKKHILDDFELVIDTDDAFLFDGYVQTAEGNFGFQGPVHQAKIVLANIQKYYQLARQKSELQLQLKQAESYVESAGNHFRRTDDSKLLVEAREKSGALATRLHGLELDLKMASDRVAGYRL